MLRPILAVLIALAPTAQPMARTACPDAGLSLQVLGSGGPIADDARAASGYLVRHDGEARVLIDAGGGTFQRFGAAGASLDTLDVIAITHVHTDHAADLPALLKGAYFSDRADPLPVAGPNGNARFPGIDTFLARLFDAETGAFAYLAGLLDGSGSLFRLDPVVVDRSAREPVTVLDDPDLTVTAIGVHHGPVPSLAYRIELDGKAIVVSGDQNLSTEGFVDFARGADLLVMPFAIPESAGRIARNLHARPSEIGTAAADAEVEHLVLSHFMARSLRNRDREIARVKQRYPGRLTAARDLACLAP